MRVFLTTIILTMLVQPASAATVESIYKNCKPYADSGFELPQDTTGVLNSVMCIGYITATIENASVVCTATNLARHAVGGAKERELAITIVDALAQDLGSGATLVNLNAAIQAFLNFAGKTKLWDSEPTATSGSPKPFLANNAHHPHHHHHDVCPARVGAEDALRFHDGPGSLAFRAARFTSAAIDAVAGSCKAGDHVMISKMYTDGANYFIATMCDPSFEITPIAVGSHILPLTAFTSPKRTTGYNDAHYLHHLHPNAARAAGNGANRLLLLNDKSC